jgi:hypothetical protein
VALDVGIKLMRGLAIRGWALAIVAILAAVTLVATPQPAQALSGSEFDPGYIISDQKFTDANTMSEAQVQTFLNSKVANCAAGYTCLKDYRTSTFTRPAVEPNHCAEYIGAANELASTIIYKTAQACKINPQVLLVLLQKETSLVTSTSPTSGTYRKATGYGCPDTSDCDAAFYGFYNQVYKAAWQFRQYNNYPDRAYRIGNIPIGWHPNAACGSSNVNVRNQATANLYNYTPYQPNAAALGNLRGTGDGCSSYGNRNFWVFFTDWFGSPTGSVDPMASLDGASLNVTSTRASIDLSGWAMDRAQQSRSIDVHVYVDRPDGTTAGYALKADQSRPDVGAAYPGAGSLHGYSTSIPVTASGKYRACVFPITSSGGWLLTCRDFVAPAADATGALDTVVIQQSGKTANIVVGGWALDLSSRSSSTEAHVYIDRPNGTVSGMALPANTDRPDIAAVFPGAGAAHGFQATVPITASGTYRVCVYSIAKSVLGQDVEALGCRSIQAMASAPVGSFDTANMITAPDGTASIAVTGWAFDDALPTSSMPVHLYVDRPNGTTVGIPFTADGTRPDVGRTFPHAGSNHGFETSIPVDAKGTYRLCAFAIGNSVFGAGNALLGCKAVNTQPQPTFGVLDAVAVSGAGADRKIVASGWGADPAAPTTSIPVHVYIDRPTGTTSGINVTANSSRPDVGNAFPPYGQNHGYSASAPAVEAGKYQVCAYSISVSRFGSNSLLGCKTVTVN